MNSATNTAAHTNNLAAWQVIAYGHDLGHDGYDNMFAAIDNWETAGNWKFDFRYGAGNAAELRRRILEAMDLGCLVINEENNRVEATKDGFKYWLENQKA